MKRKSEINCLILFFLYSFFSFSQNISSQLPTPIFETISIEDGLPEGSVTCILQDYLGYMWFGTQNGLVKYDGYSMKVFKPDTADKKSISGRVIVSLFEDKNKTLWIATSSGLNKFNREDESFNSYLCNLNDTNSISSDLVHTFHEDRFGRFWIGTLCGLNLFNRDTENFTRFYFIDTGSKAVNQIKSGQYSLAIMALTEDPLSKDLLLGIGLKGLWRFDVNKKTILEYDFNIAQDKTGWIQNFYRARDGRLWISTLNKLSVLDPISREFKCYFDFPIKRDGKYFEPVFLNSSVIEDQYGNIVAGFYQGEEGLIYLNPSTGEINKFELISNKSQNTWLNKIFSVYEDRSGIIWIGTWSTGVKHWKRYENKFTVLQPASTNSNTLSSPIVHSLVCDPKGYVWYCTPVGLDRYDQKTYKYTHYLRDEKCVTDFMVYAAMIDDAGNLWLGTSNCGLIRFNTKNFSYHFFLNDPQELNLIDKTVIYLYQDHFGFIWIGTDGFGLYKYDPQNGSLEHYENDPDDSLSLSQNQVISILEDHNENLWVGTNLGGLNKFIRETGKFTYAGFNNCLSLYEDSENRFWVTELFSGLNLFDTEKVKVVASYGRVDGLASNTIIGTLEDSNKNLWFVSDAGISRFNTQNTTIKNFVVENKLLNVFNFYIPSCSGKGIDGTMYFNTRKGLVVFNPADMKDDPSPPQIVITNLSLFNRPDETLDYNGFIPETKEITLPYKQNDLRFDYVGLQYNEPLKNTYKYVLENFDEDWVEAGTQRNATYTNLNPGTYIFRVKAANRDGVWSENEASIKIIITPPWWKTNLAYFLYALIIISIIYLTWKLQLKRIRIKNEFEMSKFEAEKMHEVDEMKSRFFANISHEFRTPLTLIFGPAKDISQKTKEQDTKKGIDIIKRNASRLFSLVNQLLDLSKLEAGKMKLEAGEVDIIPLLKGIFLSFTSFAERKNIKLTFNTIDENLFVYLDRDKMEKIINNLLSNAFKFTPEGGRIDFTVEKLINDVEIKITDNGIGIPKERIDKIYDRFYQIDSSHTRQGEGTGIGLALTKELVELHKGKIKVESKEGEGTTFTVQLPLGKDHLTPEEILEKEAVEKIPGTEEKPDRSIETENRKEKTNIDVLLYTDKPLLLIVEDNPDVRSYIISHFEEDYRIQEAVDGEDGLNLAVNHIPDLILSDVMMPKMDGIELCNKLKTDERTSHIPIIMLTAKATSKDKIEGYETGADDYIIKPFDARELKVRVKNLIDLRKKLQEKFRLEDYRIPNELRPIDEQFMKRVLRVINEHITEENFSIEMLSQESAMSKEQIYKKLKALTGKSPSLFLRSVRLVRARKMIKEGFGTISEIAFGVGFSSPAYFAKCFKEEFGYSPSELQIK